MKKLFLAIAFAVSAPSFASPMNSQDFADFRGQYALSNGSTLTMSQNGRSFVAEIDGINAFKVRSIDDSTFVSLDGNYRLEFTRFSNGVVTAVKVTNGNSAAETKKD